jgi:two-component system OmpR family sensor kinase
VRRFLRSTRGRLVLFQLVILGIASAVSAYAIYQLVSRPLVTASEDVLYGQWSTVAGGLALNADGSVAYKAGELPDTYGEPPTPVETIVYTQDGQVIAHSAKLSLPAPELLSRGNAVFNAGGAYFDASEPRSRSPRRGYADQVVLGEQPNQVAVAVVVSKSTADLELTLRRLQLTLVAGVLLVVAVGGALAWVVVSRTLRPVRALANTARAISEQELHRRVEVPTASDEVGELKATFNQLLERLEQSFQGLRRFTADASHELRSPLTLVRTEVDVALARAREPADYQRVLRNVQDEVEHMSRVIDQLLLLAQADAGNLPLLRASIDVADFVEETAARWQAVAEAGGVTLEVEAPSAGVVDGDPVLLRTVIDNLVDNAIRYSPTLAPVTLSARRSNGEWLIEVADRGPGVPREMRERIFERFARADSVRTRRGGGVGLGLALSAAVVRAHGGTLELADENGQGARFRVHLPVEQPTVPPVPPVISSR